MDNLLKLNPCTSDKSQQLRYLYDQMQVQIRGLESLAVTTESYGQLLMPLSCPSCLTRYDCKFRETDEEKWEIKELLELIRKEIEVKETTEDLKATTV